MFHSECHATFTLPEHVVATDNFRSRHNATDLEIRFDLANLETRCNLEYPGDLESRHSRDGTVCQSGSGVRNRPSISTTISESSPSYASDSNDTWCSSASVRNRAKAAASRAYSPLEQP